MHMLNAALWWCKRGFSVIPLKGKQPNINRWKLFQTCKARPKDIKNWHERGLLENIGLVLGDISHNAIVIDLDGEGAVAEFYAQFPQMDDYTLTIVSGSQRGQHLFFYVKEMPTNMRVKTDAGGFELRGNGCYVVAAPSTHPDTDLPYRVLNRRPIMRVDDMHDIADWMESLRTANEAPPQHVPAPQPGRWLERDEYMRRAYLNAAIEREVSSVSTAIEGTRNDKLFHAACVLGQFIAGGELSSSEIENNLLNAAQSCGISQAEATRTIQSGFRWGERKPRRVPAAPRKR